MIRMYMYMQVSGWGCAVWGQVAMAANEPWRMSVDGEE